MRNTRQIDLDWNELFRYDPETGKLFWKERPKEHFIKESKKTGCSKTWNTRYSGTEAGYKNNHGYISVGIRARGIKTQIQAHRIVWEMNHGKIPEGMQIDHINGHRHDNRISNLRLATHAENLRNVKMRKSNRSGFKGVSMNYGRNRLRTNPYRARIRLSGKEVFLGCYKTANEAHLAYVDAANKHFGEFARSE